MLKIDTKFTGDISAGLEKFEDKIKTTVLRSGAYGMALSIYEAAKANIRDTPAPHWFYGTQYKKDGKKYLFQPGSLRRALYIAHSPEKSGPDSVMFRVSWRTKGPLGVPYGHMVEYGVRGKDPSRPFLRKAFDEKIGDAIKAGERRMRARMSEGGKIPVVHLG